MTRSILSICFFTVLSFSLLSSCNQQKATEQDENQLWDMENAIVTGGKSVEIQPYNEGIEKAMSVRLPWVYSPLTIALKIAGQQMISPEVNLVAKSLSGNELVTEVAVIIEKKNLTDDSVADEYFWMRLKLGGTIWQVAEIKHAWKCKEGRGHQTLSAEQCK